MNLDYTSWLAGLASGGMIALGRRWPALGFVALAPLGWALLHAPALEASMAAALAGVIATAPGVWSKTLRRLLPLAAFSAGSSWALASALAAWLVQRLGPSALLLALPLAAVLCTLVPRALDAPRWVSNPLACTQERWLAVVHTARLAHLGDLVPSALLALCSAGLCLAGSTRALWPLWAAGLPCAAVLGFGWLGLRRAQLQSASTPRVRVAAVVADGPPPQSGVASGLWPTQSLAYRDVEATIARYQPQIALAAQRGARILVLPEVSVYLDVAARSRWLAAVQAWARAHDVVIVAPYFNAELPRNELAIVDARGVVGEHEKQHPGRGIEPPRRRRLPVGPHVVEAAGGVLQLSTAICVDLDYADTARSARRAGSLLAVPANDWTGFAALHHSTAVWTAVLARVPLVRATGHGISAIFDGAGRVIAQQSSEHGPVVLVADVELCARFLQPGLPLPPLSSGRCARHRSRGGVDALGRCRNREQFRVDRDGVPRRLEWGIRSRGRPRAGRQGGERRRRGQGLQRGLSGRSQQQRGQLPVPRFGHEQRRPATARGHGL